MNRLFISHSTQDLEDLQPFVEFLQLGMGIAAKDIFWTSSGSALPTGEPFVERIRSTLCDCQQVLCFLTPNYFKSKFCLAEMGAAWLQKGKILPLLVSPLDYASLTGTPLQGLQALKREERDDLLRLYDELSMAGIAAVGQTASWTNTWSRSATRGPGSFPRTPTGTTRAGWRPSAPCPTTTAATSSAAWSSWRIRRCRVRPTGSSSGAGCTRTCMWATPSVSPSPTPSCAASPT